MLDLESLLGANSSFSSMSSKERAYFAELLQQEMVRRQQESTPVQVREIVPIEKWVESEYYVGPDVAGIYPYWKEFVIDLFRADRKPEEQINQVILSGAIGTGKSTCAELIMLRKLYEISCWKNINAKFELLSKTSIMFLYFSVNKTQAERTGFGEIRAWIDSSPYFQECFSRNKRLKEALVFPEGLTFVYGSGSQHSIGMSVLGTILDEANFRGTGNGAASGAGDVEKAGSLYSSILNRAASRFITEGGVNHSLNILISSSTFESSFTEQQISKCKNDPHTKIAIPSQWDVKPSKYGKKKFWVCSGSELLEPYIVDSVDDVSRYRMAEGMKRCESQDSDTSFTVIKKEIAKLPEHMKANFLSVPTDLYVNFETNILKSLQDLAGVSVGSFGKLFTSLSVYNDCITDMLEHPFISESIVISTQDPHTVEDYLRKDFRLKHPERPRYLHIDQSTTSDCTGIASVYTDSVYEEDGVRKTRLAVDFMLQIKPPRPPKKIALFKIRNFVVYLANRLGMKIGRLTYDMFNSEESRQILQEQGFNVAYQSVDRTDKAYVDLVTLMYENRLMLYDYAPFKRELFNLLHDRSRRKVDHPKHAADAGGNTPSKDVSDALAGAVANALSATIDDNAASKVGSVSDFVIANKSRPLGEVYYAHSPFPTAEALMEQELDRLIDSLDISDFEGGFGQL